MLSLSSSTLASLLTFKKLFFYDDKYACFYFCQNLFGEMSFNALKAEWLQYVPPALISNHS
jgi:hypothetical protein